MSEPNAVLNILPHERTAIRKPSSPRVYHFERRKTAPCRPMKTYTTHPPVATHWEKRALANTQEEARQESTSEVVGSSGQGGYKTPKGHADREVYGGFPEVVEEHVPIIL